MPSGGVARLYFQCAQPSLVVALTKVSLEALKALPFQ